MPPPLLPCPIRPPPLPIRPQVSPARLGVHVGGVTALDFQHDDSFLAVARWAGPPWGRWRARLPSPRPGYGPASSGPSKIPLVACPASKAPAIQALQHKSRCFLPASPPRGN
jgi:hypothetical protein